MTEDTDITPEGGWILPDLPPIDVIARSTERIANAAEALARIAERMLTIYEHR
jgi:hypothetical protein